MLFIAFVWALGPRLLVAGFDVGLLLPQILARFIPLVNNARVPGRAMVLVYLAVAVLVAIRVARMEGSGVEPPYSGPWSGWCCWIFCPRRCR